VQTQIFSQNPAKRGIIIGNDEFNAHGMAGAGRVRQGEIAWGQKPVARPQRLPPPFGETRICA
jgi:hypothetical protein